MDVTQYQEQVQNYIFEIQMSRGKDPKASISVCNKLEDYGNQIGDKALIGFARFSRGETYYLLNDTKNFYKEMLSCIPPMQEIGEWGYVVMANNMLGIMSLNRGNAPFAMDYYIKSLAICDTYKLPDLEWIINMNIGSLYLNIEEYQKALTHLELAYKYILNNKGMQDRRSNLTIAFIGMGNSYLAMDSLNDASEMLDKIAKECMPFEDIQEELAFLSFRARYYHAMHEEVLRDESILKMRDTIDYTLPLMDLFDDIYLYLAMLIDIAMYDDFFKVFEVVEQIAKKTGVKNLELKLLSLKIRYYRETKQLSEYKQAAVLFYELSECLERENHAMVSSMIDLRNSFNDLTVITRRVEQENKALQTKSETDALTGLANRFRLNNYGEFLFEKAVAQRLSFAIEILDIDYFKQFNDNYGHQEGDYCIKEVARIIAMQQAAGEEDNVFCCRYGGDEFVIIYLGMTKEETKAKAAQLKERIVSRAIEHKYSLAEQVVTISQGICWDNPRQEDSLAEFLHTADRMLYEVKEVSRNNFKLGRLNQVED